MNYKRIIFQKYEQIPIVIGKNVTVNLRVVIITKGLFLVYLETHILRNLDKNLFNIFSFMPTMANIYLLAFSTWSLYCNP